MRKTKIICTIGPASNSREKIKSLAQAGMDIARLNFSHGTKEEHKKNFSLIRKISKELRRPIGILQDLEGHKIRTGALLNPDGVVLEGGKAFYLTSENVKGDEGRVSVCFEGLTKYAKKGASVFIDDGKIELRIEYVGEKEVKTKVIIGGILGERKGVHMPGIELGLPSLSEKDKNDICFGVELGVDYIAQSFVRCASDVLAVKNILKKKSARPVTNSKICNGARPAVVSKICNGVSVISKIEDAQGIKNIGPIIEASDGVMIARGDMGVCVPPEKIPLIQKMIIKRCNRKGTPVITATQMLDSMIRQNRPTRAEVTDVANAIIDGTDIVMLSGETASGLYPTESVKYMDRIARATEASLNYERLLERREILPLGTIDDSVGRSARELAQLANARYIVAFTLSGQTARIISRYRPEADILAVTPNENTLNQLLLCWGVTPVKGEWAKDVEGYLEKFLRQAVKKNLIKKGELVVATAGMKEGERPNGLIRVMEVK